MAQPLRQVVAHVEQARADGLHQAARQRGRVAACFGHLAQQALARGGGKRGAMHRGFDQVGEPAVVLLHQMPVLFVAHVLREARARRAALSAPSNCAPPTPRQLQLPQQARARQVIGAAAVEHEA